MKKKNGQIIIFLVFLGLFLAFRVFALTISPPVMELNANPGQKVSGKIKIFNETDKETAYYISTANFTAKAGERGEPKFFEGTTQEGLASWIEIEKGPIVVKPKEWKDIPFVIDVPKKASPGGHYAAIFLGTQPGERKPGQTAIGIAGRVGTLLLLRVSGKIKEGGKLVEFSLKEDKKIFSHLPINFLVRIKNTGTVHIKPYGVIEIRNWFGKMAGEAKVNIAKMPDGTERPVGNILPNSIRRFETSWTKSKSKDVPKTFWQRVKYEKNNFAFGKYLANLKLTYGEKGDKILTGQLSFWVFPWELITFSLILAIVGILLIFFGIKRYNRWIVKRALKAQKIKEN